MFAASGQRHINDQNITYPGGLRSGQPPELDSERVRRDEVPEL